MSNEKTAERPHCDCLACMTPANECQICRESKLESERNRAIAERDAAEAKLKALREAAGALDKALKEEGAEMCNICGCLTLATRYLGWEGDGEVLCDEHAEEERNDPNNGEPFEDHDLAIAAPLRALRAALEARQ